MSQLLFCERCEKQLPRERFEAKRERYVTKTGKVLRMNYYGDVCYECVPRKPVKQCSTCSKCNLEKPLPEFRIMTGGQVDSYCIACRNKYLKDYKRKQAEEAKNKDVTIETKPVVTRNQKTSLRVEVSPNKAGGGRKEPLGLTETEMEQRNALLKKVNTHVARPGSAFYLSPEDKAKLMEKVKQKEKPLNGRSI